MNNDMILYHIYIYHVRVIHTMVDGGSEIQYVWLDLLPGLKPNVDVAELHNTGDMEAPERTRRGRWTMD